MLKSIINSLLFLLGYFLLITGVKRLLFSTLVKEEFIDIDKFFFDAIESIIYILLIVILVLLVKQKRIDRISTFDVNELSLWASPLIVAFLYRIVEDPILRFELISNCCDSLGDTSRYHLEFTIKEKIFIFLNTVIFVPIFEELFYRKLLLNFFKKNHVLFGVVFISIAFTLLHINSSILNFPSIIATFIFSILAFIIYLKFGLISSIVFHSFYNLSWFIIETNKSIYWHVVTIHKFGFQYFIVVFIALLMLVLILIRK